jgi:hypothetical protein
MILLLVELEVLERKIQAYSGRERRGGGANDLT